MKNIGIAISCAVFFILPAFAKEPPIQACDQLAAHAFDKRAIAKGVAWDDIDGKKAVIACEQAVKTFPKTSRFNYQYGRALNKLGRFKEAAEQHGKASEQGYAAAQYSLGLMYNDGEGVPQDDKKMLHWIRSSAENGFAAAQYNMGLFYLHGENVLQDYGKSLEMFQKSADQGDADAQLSLAFLYLQGKGVAKDPGKAALWFRKSAEQDTAVAQYNLGLLYHNGQGVPKDLAEAIHWFQQAAKQKHHEALNSLAWVRATAKDKRFRHGLEAVQMAQQATKLQESESYYDTLGAAYIANGQPDKAVSAYLHAMTIGGPPTVKAFQDFLRKKEFYTGIVNGRNNAKTKAALEACAKAGCQIGVDSE